MTPRLRGVWRGIAVAAVLTVLAAPGLPQNRASREPRAPSSRPRRATPPLPAQPGTVPASPALSQQAAARPPAVGTAAPAAAAPASAPPSKPLEVVQGQGGQKLVAMEFYGLDIDHLLRLLSDAAGVTIVKSDQVTGPVTVIAPELVPLDVAFQILNSVLQVRGFTMVQEATGIWKVIPLQEALQSGNIPVRFGNNPEDLPDTSQLVTQVIPLRSLNANDVGNQIRGVLANYAVVVPTATNALIITDTASDISRALTIIADMESQFSAGLRPVHLQYYDAGAMSDIINALVFSKGGAGGAAGARPSWQQRLAPGAPGQPRSAPVQPGGAAAVTGGGEFVYPDTRTNTLIVQATPEHFAQIEDLVNSLDKPISLKESVVVYPVQNMAASDLANLIGTHLNIKPNVVQATTAGQTAGARGATGFGGTTSPFAGLGQRTGVGYGYGGSYGGGIGRTFGTMGSRVPSAELSPTAGQKPTSVEVEPLAAPLKIAQAEGGGGGGGAGMGGGGGMPVPAMPPAPAPMPGPGGEPAGGGGEAISPGTANVTEGITADNNTNTLVVTAAPERLELIKQMLEKLDVIPPQVYIQAIIAEVRLTKDNSLGFQWSHLLTQITHVRGGGRPPLVYNGNFGTSFGLGGMDSSGNPTADGLTGVITGPNGFTAIVNALASDTNARILSTPSIFTSNSTPASIQVASQLPFPTAAVTTPTGTGTGVQPVVTTSVDYKSVGIVLNVIPRVTQGDFVDMDIQVSADDPGANVNVAGTSYPSFLQRQVQNSVTIKDGNTVVLGGLMRDNITHNRSKVPILGDIPLVGALFRSSSESVEKSELLVFLSPHIVRTAGEAARLTDQEKAKLQEVPRSLQGPSDPTAIVDKKRRR